MTPKTFELTLPLPAEDAWRWLRDADRVASCFPGVRGVSTELDSVHAILRAKVGVAAKSYRAHWQQVNASSDGFQVHAVVTARTLDLAPVFQCDVTADMSAIDGTGGGGPAPGKSRLSITVDVHADPMPSPNSRSVQGFVSRIIHEFDARLTSAMQDEPTTESPTATSPAERRDASTNTERPVAGDLGGELLRPRGRNRTLFAALGIAAVAVGITIRQCARSNRPVRGRSPNRNR